tara:strand:+ start:1240 stop:1434 length:195 start_codon:yes stop_codon:yes gene_type:complete
MGCGLSAHYGQLKDSNNMSQKRPEFVTDVVPSMKYYAAAFREVFFAAEQQRDQQTQQIAREMNC